MEFVPGVRLAESFYRGAVRPLLDELGVRHSAALLGTGSEVLGFDTARSRDHDWGPRMQVFVAGGSRAGEVRAMLDERLPDSWLGYPTVFVRSGDRDAVGRRHVEVAEVRSWLRGWLGFDPGVGVTTRDWLATPTQRLAEVTGGMVFHDGLGELTAARRALRWYPDDVWRYVLACQWRRIAQEEAFPGRCWEVGDEIGSAVVTARLVRDMMRLVLLMRRRYPPYSKWLGSAFGRLELPALTAHLTGALSTQDWEVREDHLVGAYGIVADMHNGLGLTEPVDPDVRLFFDRPFRVLGADRFVDALRTDDRLPLRGAVDQFLDNTDALCDTAFTRQLV